MDIKVTSIEDMDRDLTIGMKKTVQKIAGEMEEIENRTMYCELIVPKNVSKLIEKILRYYDIDFSHNLICSKILLYDF